jgi:hypothetical protein
LIKYLNATAGLPDVKLHDLYPAFDQGLIGCEQGAKLVVLFTRPQDCLAALRLDGKCSHSAARVRVREMVIRAQERPAVPQQ